MRLGRGSRTLAVWLWRGGGCRGGEGGSVHGGRMVLYDQKIYLEGRVGENGWRTYHGGMMGRWAWKTCLQGTSGWRGWRTCRGDRLRVWWSGRWAWRPPVTGPAASVCRPPGETAGPSVTQNTKVFFNSCTDCVIETEELRTSDVMHGHISPRNDGRYYESFVY